MQALDERKQFILNQKKIVEEMKVIERDNPLITNSNIAFICDEQDVLDAVQECGQLMTVPVPILRCRQSFGDVEVKWKLDDIARERPESPDKVKVEWTETKTDDWKFEKVVDIFARSSEAGSIQVAHHELDPGNYLFRARCIINDQMSKPSNIRSVSIAERQADFRWTNRTKNTIQFSENGTRVKMTTGGGCNWRCVTSSTGWNSGKYIWRIRLNARECRYDGVGVTGEYAGASTNGCLYSYARSICCYAGDRYVYMHGNKAIGGPVKQWKPGDIMKVYLDCDAWKVAFILNGEHLKTIQLDVNRTYHPALSMCSCKGYDFKLL